MKATLPRLPRCSRSPARRRRQRACRAPEPRRPAVDVRVNGAVAFQNLSFNEVSDYADLPAGDYQIQVVPTGATEPVVIDTVLSVPAKETSPQRP